MGNTANLTIIKQRQLQKQQHEARILSVLAGSSKQLEIAKREKKRKKLSTDELLTMIDTGGLTDRKLRPAETYVPASHNVDRQVTGLINHLFVKYPVPSFLYAAFRCRSHERAQVRQQARQQLVVGARHIEQEEVDRFEDRRPLYRKWFVALAQGESFPKLVKGIMTSREACMFLKAPANQAIHENVWWARLSVAGISPSASKKLIDRIFSTCWIDDRDERLSEVIHFYAKFHQDMDKATFGEITDFVNWKLANEPAFRMKGRTLGSVVKLTNEWHHLIQKAKLGEKVEWDGFNTFPWHHESPQEFCDIIELRTNNELMNEGSKQNHCVYSYVAYCKAGRCSIFSMRRYVKTNARSEKAGRTARERSEEISRVTIEVTYDRQIVQVRGPMNRSATIEERQILKLWAGEKGFRFK